jgi:hypothetical protein
MRDGYYRDDKRIIYVSNDNVIGEYDIPNMVYTHVREKIDPKKRLREASEDERKIFNIAYTRYKEDVFRNRYGTSDIDKSVREALIEIRNRVKDQGVSQVAARSARFSKQSYTTIYNWIARYADKDREKTYKKIPDAIFAIILWIKHEESRASLG